MELKKWKNQIILSLVLVFFGYFVYWYEFSHRPQKEEAEELSKKIIPIKEKNIKTIRLVNGKKIYEFECLDLDKNLCKPGDHSNWKITLPQAMSADRGNVNSLVSSLNNVSASQTIELDSETPEKKMNLLNEYGLDEASRSGDAFKRVEILTNGGKTFIAHLGVLHPIGDQVFVATSEDGKIDDSRILLIPKYFQSNFDHALEYWRNKKLFQKAKYEISEFSYKAGRENFSGKKTSGIWTLKTNRRKKSTFTGDVEAIDGWVSNLTHLSAKGFAGNDKNSEKSKRYTRWARKLLEAKIKTESETISFVLFERKLKDKPSQFYATVSNQDPLFELEEAAQKRLIKKLNDFRQTKLISSLEKFNARRIEISGANLGQSPIVLTKQAEDWSAAQESEKLDTKKVKNLLEKLSGNRIKDFLSRSPRGSDSGIQITLGDQNNTELRKLLFWKDEKNQIFAKDLSSASKEVYLIDPLLKDALPWNKTVLFPSAGQSAPTNGKPST